MINRLLSLFNFSLKNCATKNTFITVKHMREEISIFYNGKILTPNVDYTIIKNNGANSVVRIFKELDKTKLQVLHCYIPYRSGKMEIKPWGYKKFRVF